MKTILNSYSDPNNEKIAIITLSVDAPEKRLSNGITTHLNYAIKMAYELAKICVELNIDDEEDLLKQKINNELISDLFHPYKGSIHLINVIILNSNEIYDHWIDIESFRYGV